jgi:hypothetical protein
MSISIDQSFVKQFEAEVHLAYQQMGTKLRSTVRSKNKVVGYKTVFQKIGKASAASKARHGMVPVMNLVHSNVECELFDYYAGDWVDALDELKVNIDERRTIASAGAYALGRKTDELIINALSGATLEVGDYTSGLTKNVIMSALEKLNKNDVPDDGQRFAAVGVHQWSELLNIEEFSSADYVGDNYPLLAGTENRKWMGVVWIMHNDLPLASTDDRDCFIYHKNAIGHASGADVKTDITWHGDRASFFVSNMMSQGASLIDESGIVKIKVDDDATIA